jgi:hypothetical protein
MNRCGGAPGLSGGELAQLDTNGYRALRIPDAGYT